MDERTDERIQAEIRFAVLARAFTDYLMAAEGIDHEAAVNKISSLCAVVQTAMEMHAILTRAVKQ